MKKLLSYIFVISLILLFVFNLSTKVFAIDGDDIEEPIITTTIVEEEDEENTTTTTTEINEDETNDEEPTKLAKWFSKNLGFLIGTPIGVLIASILEFLALAKKAKEKALELIDIKELKTFVKKELETANELISQTKTFISETASLVASLRESVETMKTNFIAFQQELSNQLLTYQGDLQTNLNDTKVLVNTKINDFETNLISSLNNAQYTILENSEAVKLMYLDNMNDVVTTFKTSFDSNDNLLKENIAELTKLLKRFESIEQTQKVIALNTKELVCSGAAEKIVKMVDENEKV